MTKNLQRGRLMPLNFSLNENIANTTDKFLPPLYNLYKKNNKSLEEIVTHEN